MPRRSYLSIVDAARVEDITMKWLRWIPRLLTPGSLRTVPGPAGSVGTAVPDGGTTLRLVGTCEACGSPLSVRTRHATYRGRADCACGHRNHVEFHQVREASGSVARHVTITRRRRIEAARHDPDRHLAHRYGVCPNCSLAIRLLDADVISDADSTGSVETIAYYCPGCHLHDDVRRGRLVGHDGEDVVDTVRFKVPPAVT
jgi:hypothetical protein